MAQSSAADLTAAASEPKLPEVSYLNADRGIKSWLITLDHKRIALMYLVLTTRRPGPGRACSPCWCASST